METRPPAGDAPLDASTRRGLPTIFLGVGAFYLILAVAAPFISRDPPGMHLYTQWLATSAIGLAGAAALRRWPAPAGWGNAIAGALGALVVVDSLTLIGTVGPVFIFALVVALMAFALFLLSIPWVVGLCVLGFSGWVYLSVQAGGGPEWAPRTMSLVAYCIIAVVTQAMRVAAHRRLDALKAREVERLAQEHAFAREKALSQQRRRIVRMTAHELATPMTPILLQAHVLAMSGLTDEQRRNLEAMRRNLDRLQGTIRKVVEAAQADEDTTRYYEELDRLGA